jgi:hypothetical protein
LHDDHYGGVVKLLSTSAEDGSMKSFRGPVILPYEEKDKRLQT